MSIEQLMGRDLASIASDGPRFASDPRINSRAQEDFNFLQRHGMTREQMLERERDLQRQDFEGEATKDLAGEPPEDVCDEKEIRNGVPRTKSKPIKGLPPQRIRHAKYHAWKAKLAGELQTLEAKKGELTAIIEAPAEAEGAVRKGVRRTADFLLGRVNGDGEGEAKGLADKLATAQHRADAARVALPELERDIDRARLRLNFLDRREADFLNPCLLELADHLGAIYLHQIERLRYTASVLFGLTDLVRTYGDGFQGATAITFPQMGLPSIKGADASAFVIPGRGNSAVWRQVIESLRRDPRSNVEALVPAPMRE